MTDPEITVRVEMVPKYRPICSDPECPALALCDSRREAEQWAEHHRKAYHS